MMPRQPSIRRAFSLIELLVVILIIALVISIALPSLSGARNAARAASSRALLNNITTAAAQFERDERRMPGYFTARQMGSPDNGERGFSAMQNIMLDLAGGIVAGSGDGAIRVGPLNDQASQVWVNTSYIGVERDGNKLYLVPDGNNFIAQQDMERHAGIAEHRQLPSVIDAFGTPVLAWVKDEASVGQVAEWEDFSRVDSSRASRFYWNSNAAFLNATGLGRRHTDQTTANVRNGSIIGGLAGGARPAANDARLGRSLVGLLGHPSYPHRGQTATSNEEPPIVASAPRGSIVLHSAGADGVFLSRSDRGARQFPSTMPASGANLTASHFVDYRVNFAPDPDGRITANNRYTDRDGRPTNIDIIENFSDLLAVGGN